MNIINMLLNCTGILCTTCVTFVLFAAVLLVDILLMRKISCRAPSIVQKKFSSLDTCHDRILSAVSHFVHHNMSWGIIVSKKVFVVLLTHTEVCTVVWEMRATPWAKEHNKVSKFNGKRSRNSRPVVIITIYVC